MLRQGPVSPPQSRLRDIEAVRFLDLLIRHALAPTRNQDPVLVGPKLRLGGRGAASGGIPRELLACPLLGLSCRCCIHGRLGRRAAEAVAGRGRV